MNRKLIRPEFYDSDYPLNEQEFKEFNIVSIDPYWKVRSTCYTLLVDCLGDKETLIKRIDHFLFEKYLEVKKPVEYLKDVADTDIEIVMKLLQSNSKKYEDQELTYKSLNTNYEAIKGQFD